MANQGTETGYKPPCGRHNARTTAWRGTTTLTGTTMIRIYIPTAVEAKVSDAVKKRAADAFGGFTTFDASGGWTDDDGNLITEQVEVIEVENASENWAKSTASWVAKKTDETEVMWQHIDSQAGFERQ